MSERNKNRKKELEDFLRYSQDKMSEEERNAFERSLEQDPFAAEALEGLSSITPEEAEADLASLQGRIQKRIDQKLISRRNTRTMWYRVAAAVAVLLVVTSVLFTLFNDRIGQIDSKVAESPELEKEATTSEPSLETVPIQSKADEVAADAPARKETDLIQSVNTEREVESGPITEEFVDERPAREELADKEAIPEETADIQILEVKEVETEIESPEPIETEEILADEQAAPAPAMAAERQAASKSMKRAKVEQSEVAGAATPGQRTISGMVISGDDKQPLQGVIVAVKGSKTGTVTDLDGRFEITFQDDLQNTLVTEFIGMESKEISVLDQDEIMITLEPEAISLGEVVVIDNAPRMISQPTGYAVALTESDTEKGETDYRKAAPIGGKKEFNKYINSNMQFPENAGGLTRAVVVLNFVIGSDGRPAQVLVLKSPGQAFSDEAIRLLMEGPDWQFPELNGVKIEQGTRIRMVFHKE
jgi:outer membrane biosynthesis protein TonB